MKFAPISRIASVAALCSSTLLANPSDLQYSRFSGPDLTPSPACMAVSACGDVYVGVDLLGSLGKGPDKGSIVKLSDTNNDGKADKHTVFAKVDNPRGLISFGDKVYVLHGDFQGQEQMVGMYLSVLEDKNGDGVADGPAKHLIKDISTIKFNRSRGADHTTNGIRMGIDGWIYIAVGDFGMVDAEGADGTKFTMVGGGVMRVRPDGTEMELYTYGLRNIYDVAIDPFMNIFTRGNTNDGVGWWIRFADQIQTGDYGYPSLYTYFTDEIIPALCDLGSGSGTGATYIDEPTWANTPYNKQPLMADWGRNHVYIHEVTPDGPTFTQEVKDFIGISQPTDIDVDGSGRMYIAAWQGAGYKGNPNKGFVERIVPQGWKYKAFPDLKKLSNEALVKGLKSDSATARMATSQEILTRADKFDSTSVYAIVADQSHSLETRVAALYTYVQLTGEKGIENILKLVSEDAMREHALRAATDRKSVAKSVPTEPYLKALNDFNPRVQVAALIGLGRIGDEVVAPEVAKLAITKPRKFSMPVTAKPLAEKTIGINDIAKIEIKLDEASDKLYLTSLKAGRSDINHIAWLDPKITVGEKHFEIKSWDKASQGWGKTGLNIACTGKKLATKTGEKYEFSIGSHANSSIELSIPDEFKGGTFTATIAFTDTAHGAPSSKFMVSHSPISTDGGRKKGPHATPNSKIIIPHIAVQTLRELKATEAALAAIDTPAQDGAIWALRRMHDPKSVDGLIAKLNETSDETLKVKLMDALARLYSMESPYKGDTWWQTKPDPHGPYYWETTWAESEKIGKAYLAEMAKASAEKQEQYKFIAKINKAFIPTINEKVVKKGPKIPKVADTAIEDLVLAFEKYKPNLDNGKKVLSVQACIGCHSMEAGQRKLGPDLDKIGSILNKTDLVEAIIKPDATIAENWVDATTKDGAVHQGTLVKKDDNEVIVRNIAGMETKLKASDVRSVKTADNTIMGPHLVDSLNLQEFVDMISYMASKK